MKALTASILDEHPPLKITFSASFERLPPAEKVSALRTLSSAFTGLWMAAMSTYQETGMVPSLHKLKADLPETVAVAKGRQAK